MSIKLPFIIFVLLFALIFSYTKYMFYFPYAIRTLDKLVTGMVSKLLLSTFGANNIEVRYHGAHPDFKYIEY